MNNLLDILIPTFNRCEYLKKNIHGIVQQIKASCYEDKVSIYLSNNCSTDDTDNIIQKLISENPTIKIKYYCQQHNIGLEPNVVFLMTKAKSSHVMWVGDDDYIADGYLSFCLEKIEIENIGCIIPGLKNLNRDNTVELSRIEPFEYKHFESGFDSAWTLSHLAHQMSGLVLTRDTLLESYLQKNEYRNPYLFIYWTTSCLYHLGGIYAPYYKTSITVFNQKDWGYNEVVLLDEVFKSYYYFTDLFSAKQLKLIILRFSVLHSYRYNINIFKPYLLLKKYLAIIKSLPEIKGLRRSIGLHLIKDYVKLLFK